jgi:DinB superfamily
MHRRQTEAESPRRRSPRQPSGGRVKLAAMSEANPGRLLRTVVEGVVPRLRGIDDAQASESASPDKWSAKEVLGHLIDSACNNHRRFVDAQDKADLVFDGYDGEHWVRAQRYAAASWNELVLLWESYNRHLARIIEAIPGSEMQRPRHPHTLDRIAWRPVEADKPTTLEYLANDYVGHMESHLGQIIPAYRVVSGS